MIRRWASTSGLVSVRPMRSARSSARSTGIGEYSSEWSTRVRARSPRRPPDALGSLQVGERALGRVGIIRAPARPPRLVGDCQPVLGEADLIACGLKDLAGGLTQLLALLSRKLRGASETPHDACDRCACPGDRVGRTHRRVEDVDQALVSSFAVDGCELRRERECSLVPGREDGSCPFEQRSGGMEVPVVESGPSSRGEMLRSASSERRERRAGGVEVDAVAVSLFEVVTEDLVPLDEVVVLEPVGEALVKLGASRLGEGLVGGVPDQEVAEAETFVLGKRRGSRSG